MKRKYLFVLLLIAVGLVITADRFLYRPSLAKQEELEQDKGAECWSMLATIKAEGGDVAREHKNGRLSGCEFGTTLG